MFGRPQFGNVESYVASIQYALDRRRVPWPPESASELKAALEHFPIYAERWRPSRETIERNPQLHFLRCPWKVRLVDALKRDPFFRRQVVECIVDELEAEQ